MTLNSEDIIQIGTTEAMFNVAFVSDGCHYFSIDYNVTAVNGISVTVKAKKGLTKLDIK